MRHSLLLSPTSHILITRSLALCACIHLQDYAHFPLDVTILFFCLIFPSFVSLILFYEIIVEGKSQYLSVTLEIEIELPR